MIPLIRVQRDNQTRTAEEEDQEGGQHRHSNSIPKYGTDGGKGSYHGKGGTDGLNQYTLSDIIMSICHLATYIYTYTHVLHSILVAYRLAALFVS